MQYQAMQELNLTNNSTSYPVLPENVAASVILGLCFVLGVPGNIAVMMGLLEWLKGDSLTPRLMLSLAVSDLLCLIPLPVCIWTILFGWTFGVFLCKTTAFVMYFSLYCSTLCVILLSVQRYMQVLHPHIWAKLKRREWKILLIGLWIVSGILSSYALVQRNLILGKTGQWWCKLSYQTETEKMATLLWEAFIFLLSFLLMAFLYLRLNQKVNETAFFKNHSLAKVVTRIVVTFFVFWIPFVINNFVLVTTQLLKNDKLIKAAMTADRIASVLPIINSCVNPFLYGFTALALRRHAAQEVDS